MSWITFGQIWDIFYKELSIIKWAGLIFILTLSISSLMYLFWFLLELPKLQVVQWMVESISSHESYSSKYRWNRTYYEANIHFITRDGQSHTFKSFAIWRSSIGKDFTVLYRIDDFEGMKAYTIPDLCLLWIFFIFISIIPIPVYLIMIDYFRKKISSLEDKWSKSIYRTGMIVWFIWIWFSIFWWWLIWTYYDNNILMFLACILLMFFVGKALLDSVKKLGKIS